MHKVFTCLEKGGVTGCWDIKSSCWTGKLIYLLVCIHSLVVFIIMPLLIALKLSEIIFFLYINVERVTVSLTLWVGRGTGVIAFL